MMIYNTAEEKNTWPTDMEKLLYWLTSSSSSFSFSLCSSLSLFPSATDATSHALLLPRLWLACQIWITNDSEREGSDAPSLGAAHCCRRCVFPAAAAPRWFCPSTRQTLFSTADRGGKSFMINVREFSAFLPFSSLSSVNSQQRQKWCPVYSLSMRRRWVQWAAP